MNTKIRFAALLAAAAFAAAACSSTGPTTAPPTGLAESAPVDVETPTGMAYPTGDFALTLWTSEGDADGGDRFVTTLTDGYTVVHPNVTFDVVSKDVEALAEDFTTSSLAGAAPEILWTVPVHLGQFVAADLLLPLDDMVDAAGYQPAAVGAVTLDGRLWGAPVSVGGHLMLYWNRQIVGDAAPLDTDALIAQARGVTSGDSYGLAFDQTDSLWLVPWLGGFGGRVLADDGVTPTLDTDAMRGALQFVYDLKYTHRVMPSEADYGVADGLFSGGKAAMIVNGDWALGAYSEVMGDHLGLGALPMVVGHEDPHPYVTGVFLMASKAVGDPDIEAVVSDFFQWATAMDQQLEMVNTLRRLPGNTETLADPIVTGDALLGPSAAAAQKGTGTPASLEMRCISDALTAGIRDLYTGNNDIAGIASTMQAGAETCILQF